MFQVVCICSKNERNKRLVEATNASTSALSHAEKDAKRRRYDGRLVLGLLAERQL